MRRRANRSVGAAVLMVLVASCGGSSGDDGRAAGGPATTLAAAARGATTTTVSSDPMCDGTRAGDQVVVYSTYGLEYWFADELGAFQRACAVSIAFVGLPSDQVLTRLRTERADPVADLVVLPAATMTKASNDGLIAPDPVPAEGVPDDRCGPGRRWCALGETFASWVRTSRAGAAQPVSFEDLTDPSWKGRIAYAGPGQSDAGLALRLTLEASLGADAVDGFLRRLEPNVHAHEANTDTMSKAVADGVIDVASGELQEHSNDQLQYPGLDVWFPTSGGSAAPTTVALPIAAARAAGAGDSSSATALLELLWSDTAQKHLGVANLVPANPAVSPSDRRSTALAAALAGVHVMRVDWEQAVARRDELVSQWEALRVAPIATTPITLPTGAPPISAGG